MDSLPSHLTSLPLPCAAVSAYNESHAKLRDFIMAAGRATTTNNRDRLNVEIYDGNKIVHDEATGTQDWELDIPEDADWVLLQQSLPPCIVCVRDWQNYVVDASWSAGSADDFTAFRDDRKKMSHESDPDGDDDGSDAKPESEAHLIRGDMKQLSDFIKADVERTLHAYRKNLLGRRPVAGRIMFLVLLREGTKNPQKAVNSLKNLNANEVAAVCVTCGDADISNKLSKLEQLMHDVSVAYYERRIHLLTKALSKVKPSAGPNVDETSEINAAMANFKLAYFHQFLGNFKESVQVLTQAWSHVIPAVMCRPCEEYASVALYIALQMVNARFASSNIVEALTFAFEVAAFFKRFFYSDGLLALYHNLCYLLHHAVAQHLDKANEYKELKANSHIRQHAVNFYKWSLRHLMQMRTTLMSCTDVTESPRKFGSLFFRDDVDFSHLYADAAAERHGASKERRVRYLEAVTEGILVKLMDMLSTCSWYQTLLQVTEILGDSLFLSFKLKEAFFIYANIGESLVNRTPLDTDYLLKSCSSTVISEALKQSTTARSAQRTDSNAGQDALRLYPSFLKTSTTMLMAEHGNSKVWWSLYELVLSKMMVTLNLLLGQPMDLPQSVTKAADLPTSIYEEPLRSKFELENSPRLDIDMVTASARREYSLILLKSMLTLHSVTETDFDIERSCNWLVSRISPKNDISSSVLLSKHHQAQYMLGRADVGDDSIMTTLQILVSFHVDLPFSVEVSNVTICTSIGTFAFDISEVLCTNDRVEIYTTPCAGEHNTDVSDVKREDSLTSEDGSSGSGESDSADSGDSDGDQSARDKHEEPTVVSNTKPTPERKTATLAGDSHVLLAITCPAINNKFMVDSFVLLGVNLLWVKNMGDGASVNISCVMPSLTLRLPHGIPGIGDTMFTADPCHGVFRIFDDVVTIGYASTSLKSEELLDMTAVNPKRADRYGMIVDTLVELTSVSQCLLDFDELVDSNPPASMPHARGAYRMFVNRIYFKSFLGDLVEGHVAPVTCVLLYNKQILKAEYLPRIRFSVEVTSSANSFHFYALCRDGADESGVMRLCVNNKFAFTLTGFADAQHFDLDTRLDARSGPDADTVVPTLFADDSAVVYSINEDMSNFLELAKRDANTGVVYIFGLFKALSHGPTTVQFNLQMQPMLGHTLKAMESKFLVVTDITKTLVHEPVALDLAVEHVYDNNAGGYIKFLNMHLSNKSPLQYTLDSVRVLHDGVSAARMFSRDSACSFDAEDDQLYGYRKTMEDKEGLRFMYLCPTNKHSDSAVEVQCLHAVVHADAFPFNRLQPCFQIMVTKNISLYNEKDNCEIFIAVKHQSIVELGQSFEYVAEIRNMTPHTLDYCITLPASQATVNPFMISGPRYIDMVALPHATRTVKWILMPNKCGHHNLPEVRLEQRRKLALSRDDFVSVPSLIYVTPRPLELA
ncbi:hypothetical protein, conserved [Babesia ovata]|uniref:Trafficking protein particle complex subunit 11 domain-containing protein n=1 Tax=Babesia ovata TaxID=189622 RepID=A0A2H6K6C9_9APIC|nr:uncharacterized protein BOVATA_000340 [Babesia ovata]GBE58541.1 hypothetical protein, conserved [Babesia ovata]